MGKGFYKVMVNPKGTVCDQHFYNGTAGTEELWSLGGPVACHVTDSLWSLELAVDIRRMDLVSLDGRDLVVQIVRADDPHGIYYAGWVGAPWKAFGRFGRMDFDPGTPAFQLRQVGEVGAGEVDTRIHLQAPKNKPTSVNLDVQVFDADGKRIYRETKTVNLKGDEAREVRLARKALPITRDCAIDDATRRNVYHIEATCEDGGKTHVLYRSRMPFMQYDAAFKEKFITPWVKQRRSAADWTCSLIRMPYHGKAEASVDVDFFGLPDQVTTAQRFRMRILKEQGEQVLAHASGPIVNRVSPRVMFDYPRPEPGTYRAVFQLIGNDDEVVAEKTTPFLEKEFAWERNDLGISTEVIPPFCLMETGSSRRVLRSFHRTDPRTGEMHPGGKPSSKNTIGVWGRNYDMGDNGLPKQIYVCPPTGVAGEVEDLLAAPIGLHASFGGEAVTDNAESIDIKLANRQHKADVKATTRLGPLSVDVNGVMDYDGWYEIAFDVQPRQPVQVDFLDMVIDLRHEKGSPRREPFPVDTLYVQRMGDGRYGNRFGGIREQPGRVFGSRSLLAYSQDRNIDWKSFVPRTYAGNGDRGLWVFAWSAAGWELRDNQDMLTVERLESGHVRLRIRLLAGPLKLTQPRRLKIALQAAPVKRNHPDYRDGASISHHTGGYRFYGDSVDSFSLERDKDFEALRRFLLYGPRFQEHGQQWKRLNGFFDRNKYGPKIVLYGTQRMTGVGNAAFGVFGDHWIRDSVLRYSRRMEGWWNWGGTVEFTTPEQLSVYEMNWTRSFTDFFVWYHKQLIDRCGINGTWWDNTSMFTVWDYNPELGRMESTWGLYARRHLGKRLNTVGWESMRKPTWIQNMGTDISWVQVFWMVENDWYADATNTTALEQWTLDEFRAMTRTKCTSLITKAWLRGFQSDDPKRDRLIKRSVVAMLMSHDIHDTPVSPYVVRKHEVGPYPDLSELKRSFKAFIDLDNTVRCHYAGYWRTGRMVKPTSGDIKATVYRNTSLRRAAVLLFNTGRKQQSLDGTQLDLAQLIPLRRTPLKVKRIVDLETGQPLATDADKTVYRIREPAALGSHDFRLLGVETEPAD